MAEKRRLNLAFSLASPVQREAWQILQATPAGQRTDAICRMILEHKGQRELLETVRTVVREELQHYNFTSAKEQPPEAGSVSDDVLGFLLSLQGEGDANTT